ncbi:hypothetical protein EG329_004278 [Mollisiaceae sp. DMI_Dod_QoI]|nr:hypothetical protein EG329_004278 [Helotiales sp. DMI_Dod_QoI]
MMQAVLLQIDDFLSHPDQHEPVLRLEITRETPYCKALSEDKNKFEELWAPCSSNRNSVSNNEPKVKMMMDEDEDVEMMDEDVQSSGEKRGKYPKLTVKANEDHSMPAPSNKETAKINHWKLKYEDCFKQLEAAKEKQNTNAKWIDQYIEDVQARITEKRGFEAHLQKQEEQIEIRDSLIEKLQERATGFQKVYRECRMFANLSLKADTIFNKRIKSLERQLDNALSRKGEEVERLEHELEKRRELEAEALEWFWDDENHKDRRIQKLELLLAKHGIATATEISGEMAGAAKRKAERHERFERARTLLFCSRI